MSAQTFYGERLREAREARDFSTTQVADHLEVTKQTISHYEKGRCRPSLEAFNKLVALLQVQTHYFYDPPLPDNESPLFFRSMAATTKRMRIAAEQKMKWLRQLSGYFSSVLEFPSVQLPPCDFPADPLKLSEDTVEKAADDLRRFWGMGDGVITNVVRLLESKGIIVSRMMLDTERIDGLSMIEDSTGRPFVVLAADKATMFRSRMDAAHELGHLILHRNVPKATLKNAETFKRMEEQAFAFAGAFLMPSRTFSAEYLNSNIHSFLNIKLKWKSAVAAMIMRAAALNLISESQEKTLWVERSRKGWRNEEPFDSDYEPEKPYMLGHALEMLAGQRSRKGLLFDIRLNAGDVEMFTCADGFFDDDGPDGNDDVPILKFTRQAG